MQNLVLTDENVTPERQVVLEERNMRVESEPGAALANATDAILYLRHPYGVPVIGWREEIEKLDKTDAIAFYDRFYTPNNAVLVVAGDVTEAEVRAGVRTPTRRCRAGQSRRRGTARGRWNSTCRASSARPTRRWRRRACRSRGWRPPIGSPARVRPRRSTCCPRRSAAGRRAAYRELVVDKKLAVAAGAYYQSDVRDMGRFTLYAAPRDGVSLEDLRAALLGALDGAVKTGLDDAAIARAKARLEADTIYAQDSQTSLARIFGTALVTGGSLDDVRDWPAHIRAVDLAAVKAAAGRFVPDRSVTGYLRAEKPATDGPT